MGVRGLTLLAFTFLHGACGDETTDDSVDTDTDVDTEVDTDVTDITDTDTTPLPAPELAGAWQDNRGLNHQIDAVAWVTGSVVFEIVSFDDDEQLIIARNSDDNPNDPGKFSRIDWTTDGGYYWFCQTVGNAESADDASSAPSADADAPSMMGCDGSPWARMIPLAIAGAYVNKDDDDITLDFTQDVIAELNDDEDYVLEFHLSRYDNDDRWFTARNDEANFFDAGKWSRFEWLVLAEVLYLCQVAFQEETEEDALSVPPANAFSSADGCRGYPWDKFVDVDKQ
jgi:hypothetical protein